MHHGTRQIATDVSGTSGFVLGRKEAFSKSHKNSVNTQIAL